MTTALVLFAIAAVGGLILAVIRSAAARTALIHAGVALTAASLAGVAFALRGGRAAQPGTLALALEIAGALGLGATGWLGGHLVFHHGVGVDGKPSG